LRDEVRYFWGPTRHRVGGERTRSTVRPTGPDTFRWELRVPQGGTWTMILDATYTRVQEPAAPTRRGP